VRTRVNKVLRLTKAEHVGDLSPSAVQGAIAAVREEGKSLQTCNDTLRAIKQFSRWLLRDGRAREDVLVHLTGFNVALDRRHDRRALTDDELARLIAAAKGGPVIMGMAGPDRAMLYRVAVGTGFRANELRSLVPESFDLGADPPTVTVQAAYSKHRRNDVQPVRRDLADILQPWLEAKEAGRPVFTMPDKAAKMMKKDLAEARETWVKEDGPSEARKRRKDLCFLAYRDSAGLVADFHALRHTYISRLVRSGANIKVAQELARHSTPTLTLGRYAHMEVLDRTKALNALPAIERKEPGHQMARATGTDNAVPCTTPDQERAAPGAARIAHGTPKPVLTGHDGGVGDVGRDRAQVAAKAPTCARLPLKITGATFGIRTRNPRFTKAVLYH